MRALSATELLDCWELAAGERPTRRALAWLEAAYSECSFEELARLSIGRRDTRLMRLREQVFGRKLSCTVRCTACGERSDLDLDTTDLLPVTSLNEATDTNVDEYSLVTNRCEVRFRLPNSFDLAALEAAPPATSAEAAVRLSQRCILRDISESEFWTDDLFDAVSNEMERLDPRGNIEIVCHCPACGTRWHSSFDIESFFWNEIDAWAIRLLRDVHALASAYGWSEGEILALSPWRRRCYLEMIGT